MSRTLSRRAFLSSTAVTTMGLLAGCARGAAPPASAAATPAPPSASASPGSPAASPAATPKPGGAGSVKLAWVATTTNEILWPLTKEAGYFDKYEVPVDLQYVNGGAGGARGLVSGDLHMVTTSGQIAVAAQAAKQDLIMGAGFQNELLWKVMAMPGINSLQDLKGKTVAVTRIGSSDYFGWVQLLRKEGMKVEDLKYVAVNDTPGQLTLLQSGNAVAMATAPPQDLMAAAVGAHLLIDETQLHLPSQQVGLVVRKAYVAQNRQTVINVIKATIEGMHRWITDPVYTKAILKKYQKEDDDRVVDSGYQSIGAVWPKAPYPTREGLAEVINQLGEDTPAIKSLTPEDCMDQSLVKEIEDSGFIKQVYG
jgi:NitT/TauT family transport system substrate-binding protein